MKLKSHIEIDKFRFVEMILCAINARLNPAKGEINIVEPLTKGEINCIMRLSEEGSLRYVQKCNQKSGKME